MHLRALFTSFVFLFASQVSAQSMTSQTGDSNSNQRVSFATVQVVIRKHCVSCHNEDQPRGDLVLTSLDKVLAGSSSGPVVVAGNVSESPLYALAAHLDSPKMPPNKPRIPQRELNLIERWINTGLVDEMQSESAKAPSNESESIDLANVEKVDNVASGGNLNKSVAKSPLRSLPQPTAIRAIAAHPIEPIVVVAGFHQIALIQRDTGEIRNDAINVGEREVSVMRFSNDGTRLFIAAGVPGESASVMVLDWQGKHWLPSVGEERDTIQALDCSLDATKLAIGTTARVVKTFRVDTGEQLHAHRKHTDWVISVAFSPDGLLLASGDRFGGVHVWESESGAEFTTLRGHTSGVTGLSWSNDGNRLVSSSLDGSIRAWDMHTSESVERWVAHEKGVLCVGQDAQDRIITGGRDGLIRKWGEERSVPIWETKLSGEVLSIASLSRTDSIFATDADGGIYRLSSGEQAVSTPAVETRFTLPLSPKTRVFKTSVPIAPHRISSSIELKSQETTAAQESIVERMDSLNLGSLQSDLDESRRALASVEESLKQSYRTIEQLEESVSRLKQIVVLQEARLKQANVRKKQAN